MSLKDDFVNDADIIFNSDEFAIDCTYIRDPLGDNESIISKVINTGNTSLISSRENEASSFEVPKSIFGVGDRPRYRDTINIGSQVPWTVEEVTNEDVLSFIVNCRRLERGKY